MIAIVAEVEKEDGGLDQVQEIGVAGHAEIVEADQDPVGPKFHLALVHPA